MEDLRGKVGEGGFGDSVIISNNALYQEQLGKFLVSELCMYRPQWKLCYRASSDGGDGKTFHEKCDGKPNTVTIVKVGEYVFGGYTNVPWVTPDDSGPWRYEKHGNSGKAFVFSLRNNEGLKPFKVKPTDQRYATVSYTNSGPMFGPSIQIEHHSLGQGEGVSSAYLGSGYYGPSGMKDGYTILAGSHKFTPDEWEVFYLATDTE